MVVSKSQRAITQKKSKDSKDDRSAERVGERERGIWGWVGFQRMETLHLRNGAHRARRRGDAAFLFDAGPGRRVKESVSSRNQFLLLRPQAARAV